MSRIIKNALCHTLVQSFKYFLDFHKQFSPTTYYNILISVMHVYAVGLILFLYLQKINLTKKD